MDKVSKEEQKIQIGNMLLNGHYEIIGTTENCVFRNNCPFFRKVSGDCKYYDSSTGLCLKLFTDLGVKMIELAIHAKEIE